MSKFTPWTKEQAEQWAKEYWMNVLHMAHPKYCANNSFEYFLEGWRAALAKAAEMIEASPTVYGESDRLPWHNVDFQGSTHQAKLVCAQPIKKEEPSNDQA